MSTAPALNNNFYRIRLDGDAVDNTPTWAAAENVGYTIAAETPFRIRFRPNNSGTGSATGPFILRVSKNGGAYTAVTNSTGATLGAQSNDSSTSADETAITVWRLTSTNVNGKYDETGSATYTLGISPTGAGELEYGLILKTAGTAAGNTFDFQIYNSATAFGAFAQIPRITAAADTEDNPLANDVLSASSVTKPVLRQLRDDLLANDVKSNSSVSQPVLGIRRDLLANDVLSASSVSQPALTSVAAATALLANDVVSASSVSQPAAVIRRDLLANDVKSNSSVTQPAVKSLHGLLANDVLSASSVSQPTAIIRRDLLANDIISGSSVSQPAAQQRQILLANDVLSASSVGQPAIHAVHGLDAVNVISASFVSNPAAAGPGGILAEDIVSASIVTSPGLLQTQVLDAAEVKSPSTVSQPALAEIAGSVEQALLANDVISGSSVGQPMLDRPEVVVPPLPTGGASAGGYGYYRRRSKEDEEEYEREREKREERIRDLARVIDRAIAKAQGEIEPLTEAPQPPSAPVSQPEAIAIDDALETIQERVQAIEALGSRILEADAELEALRQEAIVLMIEAELDDDDEALELLLAA